MICNYRLTSFTVSAMYLVFDRLSLFALYVSANTRQLCFQADTEIGTMTKRKGSELPLQVPLPSSAALSLPALQPKPPPSNPSMLRYRLHSSVCVHQLQRQRSQILKDPTPPWQWRLHLTPPPPLLQRSAPPRSCPPADNSGGFTYNMQCTIAKAKAGY